MTKIDFKKELKHLYKPSAKKVEVVDVPQMERREFLKAVAAGVCLGMVGCVSGSGGRSSGKPNIVLCMADDQGWGDMAYNGHPVLKTPNFDTMAASALRFDRFYAAAPVCSPTRGSVMTGVIQTVTDASNGATRFARRKSLSPNRLRRQDMLPGTSENGILALCERAARSIPARAASMNGSRHRTSSTMTPFSAGKVSPFRLKAKAPWLQ